MPAALTITGNTNDAVAAIAKLERQYDALENKVKRLGPESKRGAQDWASGLEMVATKYLAIGAVVGTIGAAVRATVAENTRLLTQLDEFVAKNSETKLKLQIQGAMTTPEVRAMMPGIQRSLMSTPSADMDQALKIQTQLASSGFAGADVKSGAALKAMLDIKAATNQFGEGIGDEAEAAKAMSMLLKAGGSAAPSAKEMRDLGGSIVSLFETSDVQFTDFKQLAPKIAGLKNFGLSMEESVATFSALTDIMGGNKADTGLAQFVSRTATTGAFPERAKLIEGIGLKSSDLAMAPGGKGLTETVDLLRGKLGGMGAQERNDFIAKLYGEEAGPAASYLLSDTGSAKMKEYIDTAAKKAPFERNVATFQNDRYAQNMRNKIAADFAKYQLDIGGGAMTWEEYNNQFNADALQQNVGKTPGQRLVNNFGTAVERATQMPFYWMGMTPEESGLGGGDVSDRVRARASAQEISDLEAMGVDVSRRQRTAAQSGDSDLAASLKRQEDLLYEQLQEMKRDKQRPINPNGNIEPR